MVPVKLNFPQKSQKSCAVVPVSNLFGTRIKMFRIQLKFQSQFPCKIPGILYSCRVLEYLALLNFFELNASNFGIIMTVHYYNFSLKQTQKLQTWFLSIHICYNFAIYSTVQLIISENRKKRGKKYREKISKKHGRQKITNLVSYIFISLCGCMTTYYHILEQLGEKS